MFQRGTTQSRALTQASQLPPLRAVESLIENDVQASGFVAQVATPETQPNTPPSALQFEARDWVLIATFENRTGEAVLDGTLEYALERELSNSAFINVVPRELIEDVLELMRKPADTRIDARVGREIAVRDGRIRAMVTGRIEKIGPTYVLTSQVVNPEDGRTVKSLSQEAAAHSELLHAVRRQALNLREGLGEMLSTVRQSSLALEKVTTPSLHALQLYSQAVSFMQGESWKHEPTEQLMKQAIAEDPDFASAYILLAWAIHNQTRPKDEFMPYASHAVRLADRTSDVERYFVLGSYHSLLADSLAPGPEADAERRQAVAAYEALMRIKPDHYWGVVNLWSEYERLKQEPEAFQWALRSAQVRPTSPGINFNAAERLLREGDVARARVFLEQALAHVTPEWAKQFPDLKFRIESETHNLRLIDPWLLHDVARVRQVADDIARRPRWPNRNEWQSVAVRDRLFSAYLGLGRFGDARTVLQDFEPEGPFDLRIGRPAWEWEVWLLSHKAWLGDRVASDSLREFGRTVPTRDRINLGITSLLVQLGMLNELREVVARVKQAAPGTPDSVLHVLNVQAQLAVAEGRVEEGLGMFDAEREGRAAPLESRRWTLRIADAWRLRGDLDRAAQVLEEATDGRWSELIQNRGAAFWIEARNKLAELYRQMGRTEEADAIDKDLLRLLAVADADHPVLVRIKAQLGKS
jgi:tetratricopeptide (TPR) repeat protein